MTIIKKIINKVGNNIPFSILHTISNEKLILPFYHAISNNAMPHIENLYSIKNEKAFIKDLDFLLKHYQPIDYIKFKEFKINDLQPIKPSFLLSFDDGLREFHDIIAPILIKKGIPAICFVNTDFIDNKNLFYRYKASLIINEIRKNTEIREKLRFSKIYSKDIYQYILSISYKDKQELDDIAIDINLNFNDYLKSNSPYLTSNEIKSLINKGFHFGSHSIDHPEFQYLDLETQIIQTKESLNYLMNKFSLNYKIFSFPFTDFNVSIDYFNYIKKNEIFEFSFGTAGQKKDCIPFNIQRIPFENGNLSAENILKIELLYYLIKMPLSKNTIKRNGRNKII
ncbi:MAG TPA: polysaccharide deacetylase family protein [Bacteroidales bacterium]|nr:MAG: Polysaccharide deacetylase [Bacteroidetes bacterium ADurb.Bin217]HOS83487.1 polysaccharide deacetylase family protein [Bacteroidales bacterium]HPH15559.1 polysaccharide deacetylase family protein [Bacteroidales bacterium]